MKLKGDLLDFGGGTGGLVRQIGESDFMGSISAADILPRPENLPISIQWMRSDLNDPLRVPDNSFNVVVSAEVIEHLENPRAVFREFYRILRPGGTLILTTPNQESIRAFAALLFGGHFVAFLDSCYPAHITALLRKDIVRICTETGFDPPRFDYTNVGGLPKCPRILWQDVTFGYLKGRLFSDNLMAIVPKALVPEGVY